MEAVRISIHVAATIVYMLTSWCLIKTWESCGPRCILNCQKIVGKSLRFRTYICACCRRSFRDITLNSQQPPPELLNSDNSIVASSFLSPHHPLLLFPSIYHPPARPVSFSPYLSSKCLGGVRQLRLEVGGSDQKIDSLQWNKPLHNSCGEMVLIADWFEEEAADTCDAGPHLPCSLHHSPLWLSIVWAVYFVVMSGKWQVKKAKGARHQIGTLSRKKM